jgi:hypothetical protein
MRQLTFVEPRVVEWRDVPDPVLQGAGEALVRPVVVANCDLDRLIISGRFPEIVALVADGRLHPELVNSTAVGWEDAPAAMLDLPTKLIIERD